MVLTKHLLYLIEILHQTTTPRRWSRPHVPLYLIEILHQTTTGNGARRIGITLYLIEILHQTTTQWLILLWCWCCILLKFYIKPQPTQSAGYGEDGCILLKFYIKPQRRYRSLRTWFRCILLKFYIKPQPYGFIVCASSVVSYWNSTSNHNVDVQTTNEMLVVSYWNSTSNHNSYVLFKRDVAVVSYWNSTSNHNVRHWIDWYIALYIKIIIIKKSEFTLWRSRFDVFQYVKEQGKYTENI